jgi:hypothetical protein
MTKTIKLQITVNANDKTNAAAYTKSNFELTLSPVFNHADHPDV